MTDMNLVNDYVLKPLMLKNSANSFEGNQNQVISEAVTNNITVRKVKIQYQRIYFEFFAPTK